MYKFSELSKRAQLIAIGHFIKTFKANLPEEDMTIETARTILEIENVFHIFDLKGFPVEPDGFYIRQVPSSGEWVFYAFYEGSLKALSRTLAGKHEWLKSTHVMPFKSTGFIKVEL